MMAGRSWWRNQMCFCMAVVAITAAVIMTTAMTCIITVSAVRSAAVAAPVMAEEVGILPAVVMMAAGVVMVAAAINTKPIFLPMNNSHLSTRFFCRLTVAQGFLACGLLSARLLAADSVDASTNAIVAQRVFDSPAAAVTALQVATERDDQSALRDLFGPDFPSLKTGDPAQDTRNANRFATAMSQSCQMVTNADDNITLEVGTNQWPMPIPLVRSGGQWHFDTAAGKEEVINRHIGKDELHAIGVCRAYVTAQLQRRAANPSTPYALKFASTEGTQDGLYWPASVNAPASPFGPLVAMAQTGYYVSHRGKGPQPFHGYYFKVLTRQGPNTPGGKMSYLHFWKLTKGFALVAYPENWGQSGIMTFIVNQDGKVYQQDLGATTRQTVRAMKEYNPDSQWTLVADDGVARAAAEQ